MQLGCGYARWKDPFSTQDDLLLPEAGRGLERSGPYLVFAWESQGCWQIATLPQGDDPGT